ncbi:hypothetical protein [Paraliomyxa miuraensis]|uniref:hypothetical protein n=1 Tax=Paraliomyxa miuraensis TaxID=376150 RepID=UPI00225A8069|nr:hypothetical protein [Paraliomyxa miuraensis]MCX4239103.1 hypothetical protein [Paraliomyxa miuraensis]
MKVPRAIVIVAAVAAGAGCKVLDDDEPPLPMGTSGGEAGTEGAACMQALDEIQNCDYPLQWWFSNGGGGGDLILMDDPAATVSVGTGAWLVMLHSEADYIGMYSYENGECLGHCGWCEAGQIMCHGGLTEETGEARCVLCLPYDQPDAGEQCAVYVAACLDGWAEGLDETGAGTTDGAAGYDCSWWHPEEGVQRDGSRVTVDAALIEEALLYQGEPLATCDGTRFRPREDGHLEVSRLGEHGLAVAMGLELGDALLAVDGQHLNSIDAMMNAASKLGAGSFAVTLERAGEPIELSVVVH